MRWLTILVLLNSGSVYWAWSTVSRTRLAQSISNSKNELGNQRMIPAISTQTQTIYGQRKRTLVLGASSGDNDSAMSAYDRAMKAMAAQPSDTGGGTGVKEYIPKPPVSPATSSAPATTSSATGVPQPVDATAISSSSASSETDAGMSVYDQYLQQQKGLPDAPPTSPETTPERAQSDFVAPTFNDASVVTQENNDLEEATTWTSSFPSGKPPGPPSSPATPATATPVLYSEQPLYGAADTPASGFFEQPPQPQQSPPSAASSTSSFMDALAPNSGRRKPTTTGAITPPPPQTAVTPPEVSQSAAPQTWEPPLSFLTETEEPVTAQSLEQTPATIPPPVPQPLAPQVRQQFQEPPETPPLEQTPATIPPPVPQPLARPQVQQQFQEPPETPPPVPLRPEAPAPIIPPSSTTTTDPIARMAAAASSSVPPTPLNSTSFMSTGWEESQEKTGFLSDPVKYLKNTFGGKAERRRTPMTQVPEVVNPGVAKRIFESLDSDPNNPRVWSPWDAFQNAEDRWYDLKNSKPFRYDAKLFKPFQNEAGPPLQFVSDDCAMGNAKACSKLRDVCQSAGEECQDLDYEGPPLDDNDQPIMDYDVAVLGGTLGIFYAMALQNQGLRVCVVAPRELRGQDQEWNVGMEDLMELQRCGVLVQDDIDAAITTVYGGARAGFKNREITPLMGGPDDNKGVGFECYLNDVLNLGVSPAILIDRVVARFLSQGGTVKELCPLKGVAVSEQIGCAIDLDSYNPAEDVEPITAKMVLDCMGYGSPVARQQRYGVKPDSICMVFGSCAGGYNPDRNRCADIMYTFNPLQDFGENGKHQYFWESFPVGTKLTAPVAVDTPSFNMFGVPTEAKETLKVETQVKSDVQTTYMFTYMDADAQRPTLEALMEDYWKYLPTYQSSISDPENQLDIKRVVYDYFPAYRDSPMKPQYSRVLSVGESAGMQSPLSFGGFRSVSRHIGRISGAITEAVETGCLHKDDLAYINEYSPQVGAGWFLRDIMSVPMDQGVNPQFTNRVLSVYLKAMYDAGPGTITPFMHDVLKFDALVGTMVTGILSDPSMTVDIVKHVGLPKTLDFLGHVANMGLYGLLDASVSPIMEGMIKKMKAPRTRFKWRRRLEGWKYGSGSDYLG